MKHDLEKRQPIVRLEGVSMSFFEGARERRVLDGLDLEIAAGERLALLGRSGSGKSTLLNLIAALEAPSEGSIEVVGQRLERLDESGRTRLRRDHIGFVFQSFNLVPTLTVAENVLLPLELSGRVDTLRDTALARLETLGLASRQTSFPDVLSGGEQQRVAIARALAHAPDLVLADEPTGNLDDATAAEVLDLLESTIADAGATLAMATHSHQAAHRADRILRIEAGRLVEAPPRRDGRPGS